MAKNWALVVGINDYNRLNYPPLKYAKCDAEKMRDFFQSANFEQVFFFSDDSPRQALPNGTLIPTQATYGNLISFLQGFFDQPFLDTGDNFWFFFAGHGERHQDQDYLLPMDANAIGSEALAALSVNYLRERLCRCGADNVIMILDACRSEGSRSGRGIGEAQPGVITIASCQPTQKSWEVDELGQGVFTHALLEALQLSGERSCATVERLGNYLKQRVPELCQRHGKSPTQRPRVSADPLEKQHFILMPKAARQADIDLLKLDAYRLRRKNPALTEKICIRLNALAMGQDLEVIDLLTEVRAQFRYQVPQQPVVQTPEQPIEPPTPAEPKAGARPAATTTVEDIVTQDFAEEANTVVRQYPTFSFETVLVNEQGKVIETLPGEAEYTTEDLGDGITLDMVRIPGGTFMMGAAKREEGASKDEYPQHKVTVPEFWMGKFAVTQVQWQAVVNLTKVERDLRPAPANFKGAKRPVEQVSWQDAVEFCKRLSQKTGGDYRLPSEAEWEYACRAGTTTPFHFGPTIITDLANYRGTDWKPSNTLYPGNYGKGPKGKYRQETIDVGSFTPNAFGLYDMHGNVWEWCLDGWNSSYKGAPSDGSAWKGEKYHVLRGGSWFNNPTYCRAANRFDDPFGNLNPDIGFRVVSVAPSTLQYQSWPMGICQAC